jgi:uncharacterized protein
VSQALPLIEQLKNLEHLQELDLKIDSLKKDQNSLPSSLRQMDDSLNKLRVSLDSKKNQASEIEKVQRQTLAALDLNKDRLARSNTKLEAVHNSQEFQAANKEIEQLKKLNVSLEEQLKKANSELEITQKDVIGLEAQFNQLKQERDAQATVLSGQDSQYQVDISALVGERSKYTVHVESRILSQYDRIRGARGGLGIVPAVGGRCKGCNMMVPPQLYNEVQKGSALHSCPSCHRLLFVSAPQEKVENLVSKTVLGD